MSASASAPPIFSTPWAKQSELPAPHVEPAREGRWTRLLCWLTGHRHLREMDTRLLRDVGLTREDVWRGVPFRAGTPCPAGLIRLGTLDARACRLKFYALAAEADGLRPEDLAAGRRAFLAVLAEPGRELVAGFAVLAGLHAADPPAGSLVLTDYRWERAVLRRCALLLPLADEPVHRLSDHGLGLAELRLAACGGQAWQRHAARPSSSTLAAYLAEDCA